MANENRYTLETMYQIWNDRTGEHIELGPDRDGLELFEIRSYTDDGKITQRVVLTREQLILLRDAIQLSLESK